MEKFLAILNNVAGFLGNLFGYKQQKEENEEIKNKEARDIFDMANADIRKEESELKKAKLDLKTYKKKQKLVELRKKDIEKAAADRLGISLSKFRRLNKKLKQQVSDDTQ